MNRLRRYRRLLVAVAMWLASATAAANGLSEATLAALRAGEAAVLLRHASAPGLGDPPHFRLGDCSTQRNLSPAGEAQATRIGEAMRAAGLTEATVWTSPWCRCRDTAARLGLGTPMQMATFGSFFDGYTEATVQTRGAEHLLAQAPPKPLVVVTHQVNITALTEGKVFPRPGEAVVVLRRRPATVLQRWQAAD